MFVVPLVGLASPYLQLQERRSSAPLRALAVAGFATAEQAAEVGESSAAAPTSYSQSFDALGGKQRTSCPETTIALVERLPARPLTRFGGRRGDAELRGWVLKH